MRTLVALTLSLTACTAQPVFHPVLQPVFQAGPVMDPGWPIPAPDSPASLRYLQPQTDRDPDRSRAEPNTATKDRVRARSALRVTEADPRGLLEVSVRFPTGEFYGLGGYICVYPTGPLDLSKPIVELQYTEHHSGSWTKLWLPPGEYEVVADSGDYVPDCMVGWTPTLPAFGPTKTTLKIRAGETTPFEAVLRAGGRLRLTIGNDEGPRLQYVIRLIPEEGPAVPLSFFEHEDYPAFAAALCPSGAGCISSCIIPAGHYTLECEADDGVVTRADVLIGDARVTDVRLKVPPPLSAAPRGAAYVMQFAQ